MIAGVGLIEAEGVLEILGGLPLQNNESSARRCCAGSEN